MQGMTAPKQVSAFDIIGPIMVGPSSSHTAGAAQCFVAVDLALAGVESVIPPDEVIDAMANIGRRMDVRFKETAQGGLAATPTGKKLAELVWAEKRSTGEEQK